MHPILKTIYAAHYFNGEHPIKGLIKKQAEPKFGLYGGEELDGDTLEALIDAGILDKEQLKAFIKEKYDVEFATDSTETIIFIQYPEGREKAVIPILYNNGLELIDNAGGDDDTFDYMPGAIDCLGELITKLGSADLAKDLYDRVQQLHDSL